MYVELFEFLDNFGEIMILRKMTSDQESRCFNVFLTQSLFLNSYKNPL